MGEAYLDWQKKSGGIKLNDVIEEFKYVAAGKKVNAGDLVNYINGVASKIDYGESVDTQLSNTADTAGKMSVVALDDSRVFVAYYYGSDKYLYGMVVTINGASISAGIETQLSTTQNTGSEISTCLLPNGNVFIAHSYYPTHLYGMVIIIDGTTITVGTDTALNANNGMGLEISTCLLPNGNVFIAHGYGTYRYLYGMVVTVDGTTLTKGTDTLIVSNDYYPGYCISACLLHDGNVFIAHGHGGTSNLKLYGIVCTISGKTITKGTDTVIIDANYSGEDIAACTLTNGNVFIAHNIGGNNNLGGIVCKISGTTITAGSNTTISTTKYTGQGLSVVPLPNQKVFIAYRRNNSPTYLNGVVCSISDTTITKGTEKNLNTSDFTGGTPKAVLLPNGIIFISHMYSTSSFLYAQIFSIDESDVPTNQIVATETEQQVTPATEPPFNAIALSSGVGGTDTEHNEQVKIARPSAGGDIDG